MTRRNSRHNGLLPAPEPTGYRYRLVVADLLRRNWCIMDLAFNQAESNAVSTVTTLHALCVHIHALFKLGSQFGR